MNMTNNEIIVILENRIKAVNKDQVVYNIEALKAIALAAQAIAQLQQAKK